MKTVTEAGYRLYDDTALERLQHILLFRELEFPLKDISFSNIINHVWKSNCSAVEQVLLKIKRVLHLS